MLYYLIIFIIEKLGYCHLIFPFIFFWFGGHTSDVWRLFPAYLGVIWGSHSRKYSGDHVVPGIESCPPTCINVLISLSYPSGLLSTLMSNVVIKISLGIFFI